VHGSPTGPVRDAILRNFEVPDEDCLAARSPD
jgi:hypothetical protein